MPPWDDIKDAKGVLSDDATIVSSRATPQKMWW